MVEVIVPSRFDQLVNNDGTATTLFSAYLEAQAAKTNDTLDIVEPYYRSLVALAALRAEVEDLKIIHSVNLIPVDDTLQKRIDDLQEELIGFVMGLINQKDLTGFLRNVAEDVTPQLGGNLDTQSFTVDSRNISTDGTKLDGIESGATVDQTASDIRTLGFFDITNDGTGSGLDADLLDGNHSNAFATSAQGTTADNALPKAGGIMTGIIDGNNTTDSTSSITGSIHTDGGIGVVKQGHFGKQITIKSGLPTLDHVIGTADALLIKSGGVNAINTYQGSIIFTESSGGGRRTGLVSKQTGTDNDQHGLAFLTHPSASVANMVETMLLDHVGNLSTGTLKTTGAEIGILHDRIAAGGNGYIEINTPANRNNGIRFRHAGTVLGAIGLVDSDEGTGGDLLIGINTAATNNYVIFSRATKLATFAGAVITNSTTESTSTTTGSIQTDGGLGVVKNLHVGGEVFLNLPTSAGTAGSLWNDGGTVKVA